MLVSVLLESRADHGAFTSLLDFVKNDDLHGIALYSASAAAQGVGTRFQYSCVIDTINIEEAMCYGQRRKTDAVRSAAPAMVMILIDIWVFLSFSGVFTDAAGQPLLPARAAARAGNQTETCKNL
jgi:hypothetical protein